MIEKIKIENILFLDIETVPVKYQYSELDAYEKYLWDTKMKWQVKGEETTETLYEKSGVYAEFAKIICISVAFVFMQDGKRKIKVKSFAGHDEKKLLTEFAGLLVVKFNTQEHMLCAHNGKEFDFPFICRRMLINAIKLPIILNVHGRKPWETPFLDTMELWRFGDYKNFTSLELIAHLMGVPSPKDDITGADVKHVYYQDKDLDRISNYCKKDTLTVAQLFIKYRNEPLIPQEDIIFV
ncbi:MAG TPA: 3'-5' exonuclease [Flavobacteriales bacterium]|nr:3'-5' exonuclease [Flavobacteriales bacterium]